MQHVDRAQYEILQDEEIPYNAGDSENYPRASLELDSAHNLDLFFSHIYEYHQAGGFTVS